MATVIEKADNIGVLRHTYALVEADIAKLVAMNSETLYICTSQIGGGNIPIPNDVKAEIVSIINKYLNKQKKDAEKELEKLIKKDD